MKRNKLGKFSDEAKEAAEKEKKKEEEQTARASTFNIGDRCQTSVPKYPLRRGVIMFIGKKYSEVKNFSIYLRVEYIRELFQNVT